jgi:hypothetical protein
VQAVGDTELLAGFTWQDLLHDVVARVGSLAAVAERLAHDNGFADDVGSLERGLRRLRARGHQAGGKWGARLLACFGLPGSVEARLRRMASYHSRFTDLPVPVAADLLRLWDHPPTTDRREARACLALARASIELRKRGHVAALRRLDGVVRELDRLPPELRTSVRTRRLDHAAAEALYRVLPTHGAPPFVLCRRANGLALHRQGRHDEAAALAREAARHAGDGGHVRLRVMALSMLARIDPREASAREQAVAVSARLEDEALLLRLAHGAAQTDVRSEVGANGTPARGGS